VIKLHIVILKKNQSGPALVNGCQLFEMVKRGMQDYRKAIAFTKDKWDLKKNSPIKLGTTVDDVIEYVRRKMYLSNLVVIDNDNDEVNLRQKEVDIIVDVA
jgi:hypothetical protein